ncbi:AraC family transcriptional regulator [Vibrio sp. S12_S33]|uniref:AraC family transcriptional regulator n=1 Tax=Vibrio sp. S12_S33 TaxID=2720223 RepID=UPI001782E820|nr:helix-turn-helix transcriptional regulator [Vibrio sp. S12_S33]MBD1567203.1 AraC family transcriptional regulator [Vibrio sp. S12_S33]
MPTRTPNIANRTANKFEPKLDDKLPTDIFFHYFFLEAKTETLPHSHMWGQLHIIKQGVLEMEVDQQIMVCPASYAIWTPANQIHRAFNRGDIEYCAINIALNLSKNLPGQACMIPLTPLIRALIDDLVERKTTAVLSEEDKCMGYVLMERLAKANIIDNYLPSTCDKLLAPILAQLQENPADDSSLATWAKRVFSTERTLTRRFKKELNMSFNDWRQRAKLVKAIILLKESISINEIAFELGYSQGSSFIKMFRKLTGVTPDQFRKLNS